MKVVKGGTKIPIKTFSVIKAFPSLGRSSVAFIASKLTQVTSHQNQINVRKPSSQKDIPGNHDDAAPNPAPRLFNCDPIPIHPGKAIHPVYHW